jgi:hypothetical protein
LVAEQARAFARLTTVSRHPRGRSIIHDIGHGEQKDASRTHVLLRGQIGLALSMTGMRFEKITAVDNQKMVAALTHATGSIGVDAAGPVVVRGAFRRKPDDGRVMYVAPCPPDRRQSFFGSALPFPNADVAYDGTPNRGAAEVDDDGRFEIALVAGPNSYCGADGKLVPPALTLYYAEQGTPRVQTVHVGEPTPHRRLRFMNYEGRRDASFYARPVERVRSQEAILRSHGGVLLP